MVKNKYVGWSKEQLIEELNKLKKIKKFGLVWEDKPEDVEELCKTQLPILEEVKSKLVYHGDELPTNIFIEGDNYHALSVLNYTHAKKLDLIYIDPPYNTGAKDWKYNNAFVDINDGYRHSKWLSMMAKRLKLAKRLLKVDGVLIIAIDDNEVHRLRLLIDELMPGYTTTSVTIVHNPRGNITNNFARTHEYALFVIPKRLSAIARVKKENSSPRKLRRWGHNSTRLARPTMFYPIYVKEGKICRVGKTPVDDFHPGVKNIIKENGELEIWPIDQNGIERRWNFGLDKIKKELNRIIVLEVKGEIDLFISEEDTTPKTVWTDSDLEAGRNGATLVKAITGADFPYPKSIFTVKKCIELILKGRPNAVVLDFFAGSGTTGHAVMMLNAEDEGNRRFILCTNNENNIADEVTYPRIKKTIEGVTGLPELTGFPSNLRYFKTAFVDALETDSNKLKLVKNSTEMICLKENCFELIKNSKCYKIYTNKVNKYLGIIYDDAGIMDYKTEIKNMNIKTNTYVFSLDDSAREEEFGDIINLVELKPIPEVILNVYRRIFK